MKRSNSPTSISRYGPSGWSSYWLAPLTAAALIGCAEQNRYPVEQAQCLAVMQAHTNFAELTDSKTWTMQHRLGLSFEFTVNSVFGPKAASGECIYPLEHGTDEAQPLSIQIGNTLHTDPASITALISGRSENNDDHSH